MRDAAAVALCITGLRRTLTSEVVVHSLHSRVLQPLRHRGVEVFIVETNSDPGDTELRKHVAAAFPHATDIRLQRTRLTDRAPCPLAHHKGYVTDNFPVYTQWLGFETCYDMIGEREARRNLSFEWILRTRSDLVFFTNVSLPTSLEYAYVPTGGMNPLSKARCFNDHLFLCPRALCAPYFRLLRLFRNASCTAPAADLALVAGNETAAAAKLLAQPGDRLRPFFYAPQWYFFTAYNGLQPSCASYPTASDACCGRLREIPLLYAVARPPGTDQFARPVVASRIGVSDGGEAQAGQATPSQLLCRKNLVLMWRPRSLHSSMRSQHALALRRCEEINTCLNSSQANQRPFADSGGLCYQHAFSS